MVRFTARHIPTWRRLRTSVMQVTAFGFLDCAAFQWHLIFGLISVGVSLLILEALGGESGGRR